ncbi:hypothetical protein LIER_39244 [Lithospermum erythrorhizon]|uniref:Uncharacterized protein n=1 Tax=Lithospermum erythrorhizon TaxID=34254 RepID=A0AAV3QBW2_LITER
MTTKQRETQSIASFKERFQSDFNLIRGANQKIIVIAFVEGLQLSKFKCCSKEATSGFGGVQGSGVVYTPEDEGPNTAGEIQGSQKNARGCYVAFTKQIKAWVEEDTISRGPEGSRDQNVYTLEAMLIQ